MLYSYYRELLASGSYDGTIKLWNPNTGKEIRTLKDNNDRILSLTTITTSTSVMLVSCNGKTIKLWNPETGEEIRSLISNNGASKLSTITISIGVVLASGSGKNIKL